MRDTIYVIQNAVKNLSERIDVSAIVDGRAIPEILRSAQDDNVGCKHALYVIPNAVKNLAASTNIQRLANLEILRYAQDDENNKWCVLQVEHRHPIAHKKRHSS